MSSPQSASAYLAEISSAVERSFHDDRSILAFAEWMELFLEDPARNLRSAAQYVRDTFDHFGSEIRALPRGEMRRYRMFDAPWADGDGRVAGQEQVQGEIYRLISNFVKDGRVSKLILLHGPNGSAKSSLVRAIQTGMEHYSRTREGALYSYAWIFPSEKVAKGSLGFGSAGKKGAPGGASFARLDPELVDTRLPCETRDHPIFFIPRAERLRLINDLRAQGRLPGDFVVSRYVLDGDLSPRDRAIYDALLFAYNGRHEEVLRHVQVERFFVSAKHGRGVATVDPQDAVDAHAEQLTADRSLLNLPRAVQNVPLHKLWGPLISANRGLLEYADILKRPAEFLKYLLTTSEEATVSLPQFKIGIDEILVASTNEIYLEAFKKTADWSSFKGRMELVAVPYLRRFADEILIYDRHISPTTITKPLAPHVVEVAAMWAVLTRLKRPDKTQYPPELRTLIDRLTPLDKLKLYDTGEVPPWCTTQEAKELRRAIGALLDEGRNTADYEGNHGASAREIRTLILNAAHQPNHQSLTPLPVLDELRELISDRSVYRFLQVPAQDGYHDHEKFIEIARQWWLDVLDDEVRTSMGLFEEKKYEELFGKYVRHVSHHLKKEKMFDRVTGKLVDADEELMKEVEASILPAGERREEFRRAIIGAIGAWGLENVGKTPDYRQLFPHYVEKLESDYYRERKKLIAKRLVNLLKYLGNGQSELVAEEVEMARSTLSNLTHRFGYPEVCAAECCAYLRKERYAQVE